MLVNNLDKDIIKLIGESILFASIQFSIGSVELSSKFSVKNFAKDNETLNNAISALHDYIMIAFVWTIGVCMMLYSSNGIIGILCGLISNLIIIAWIYFSYIHSFKIASEKYNLDYGK
jgi:hypothetical protein